MEEGKRENEAPELGFTESLDADEIDAGNHDEEDRDPHRDVHLLRAIPVVENESCGDNLQVPAVSLIYICLQRILPTSVGIVIAHEYQ